MAEVIAAAPDGSRIEAVTLKGDGLTARVMSYGATLTSLHLDGVAHSLILGSPDPAAYVSQLKYFGAVVGPVANRIGGGRFIMDGAAFDLDRNEAGITTLHGGSAGIGQRNWHLAEEAEDFCTLTLTHADGHMGLPGPIDISVTYRLEAGALEIEITGLAGATALFSPAFHGYWSLTGGPDVLGHLLQIDAETYVPVDARKIPIGTAPVAGTEFDYRAPRPPASWLDHNFCTGAGRGPLRRVARVTGGGLVLEAQSTEPGLQVYSGAANASGAFAGNDGPLGAHSGLALEPQLWPDAPNRPTFPSARIEAGQTITQLSRFCVTRTE